jgi:hypothetical protein
MPAGRCNDPTPNRWPPPGNWNRLMARIRTIQPDFPMSGSMTRVSREARLLFIQLWTLADDAGRLRAEPLMLAEEFYPSDTDAPMLLVTWLDALEHEGCIERYRSSDEEYLRIVRWRRYQKVDHPRLSRLPAAASQAAIREIRDIREESPESQSGRASRAKVRDFDFSEEEAALVSRPVPFIKEGRDRRPGHPRSLEGGAGDIRARGVSRLARPVAGGGARRLPAPPADRHRRLQSLAAEYGVTDPTTVTVLSRALDGLVARTVDVYGR